MEWDSETSAVYTDRKGDLVVDELDLVVGQQDGRRDLEPLHRIARDAHFRVRHELVHEIDRQNVDRRAPITEKPSVHGIVGVEVREERKCHILAGSS